MKINKRFILVLFLTLTLLLASTFPAAAAANKVVINGMCSPYEKPGDPAFPPRPDYRFWTKKDESVIHWRNNTFFFKCAFNDERLPEFWLTSDNWNLFYTDNAAYYAQTFGHGYDTNAEGEYLGLWQIDYTGFYDKDWKYTSRLKLKGRCANQGVLAKLVMSYEWWEWPYIHLEGELIVPENK